MTRAILRALGRLERLPPSWVAGIVVCGFAMTLGGDAVLHGSFNPHLPLFLWIFIAAWCLGEAAGVVAALVATGAIAAINGVGYGLQVANPSIAAELANAGGRWLMFSWFALLASSLRCLVERERSRASRDPLTGALNRQALAGRAADVIDRARASGRSLVLAYVDLDDFKRVNDRHGHAVGDRVLTAFAEAVAGSLEAGEILARVGGDEFVLLLLAADQAAGERRAEQVAARLAEAARAGEVPVTCSIGAVVARAAGVPDAASLTHLADLLMYEVKRSGRNAVRVALADDLNEALARPAARPIGLRLNRDGVDDSVAIDELAA